MSGRVRRSILCWPLARILSDEKKVNWQIVAAEQTSEKPISEAGCGMNHSITNRFDPSLSTPNIIHLMYISGNGCSISRTDTLYPDRTLSIPTGCRILRGVQVKSLY